MTIEYSRLEDDGLEDEIVPIEETSKDSEEVVDGSAEIQGAFQET